MSKLPRDSSLLQNPGANSHNHFHPHNHPRSLPQALREKRQIEGPVDAVTEIIETVSLVQVVDADGVPIEIQTILSPPTTVLVDPATGEVIEPLPNPPVDELGPTEVPIVPDAPDIIPPIPSGPIVVSPSDGPSSEPSLPPPVSASLPSTSVEPAVTATPSSPETSQDDILTSTPLSSSSAFPTLAGPFNLTNGFRNGSVFTNSTSPRRKTKKLSTATLPTPSSAEDDARIVVVITATPEVVPGDAGAAPAPADVSTGPSEPPPTSTVVGSVVGSIAGAALVIFLVMALVRWRKRQMGRERIDDGRSSGTRGLLTDGSSGGGMTQKSLPFVVPAVLSSLSGYKQRPVPEASKEEKGFYRVSGKKLPSVLEHGGDGYTDPRQSVMSASSSHYGDSQMFEPEQGRPPRLALGSPMRPVSGVMFMRTGPARTPVTEENPFSDPPTPSSTLRTPDPIGRSLTGQDSSRVSSRFTEEV